MVITNDTRKKIQSIGVASLLSNVAMINYFGAKLKNCQQLSYLWAGNAAVDLRFLPEVEI
jgi:hypothetical protein